MYVVGIIFFSSNRNLRAHFSFVAKIVFKTGFGCDKMKENFWKMVARERERISPGRVTVLKKPSQILTMCAVITINLLKKNARDCRPPE